MWFKWAQPPGHGFMCIFDELGILLFTHTAKNCFFFFAIRLAFWSFYFSYPVDVMRVVFNKQNGAFSPVTSVSSMVQLWWINANVTCSAVFVVRLKWRNPGQSGMLQTKCAVILSRLNQSCFQAYLYSHWSVHRGRRLTHVPFSPPPSFPRSYSVC